jgi:oligosaccharyltransferase complex subunit alpha (ribophorin I)
MYRQVYKNDVRFTGNHYVYLPYSVVSQSTTVTLASSNIESYSKLKPVSQSGESAFSLVIQIRISD